MKDNKSQYINAMCKIAYNAIIKYLSHRSGYGFSITKFNQNVPIARHLYDENISFKNGITYNEFRQKFDAEIFKIDNERSK